MFAAGLDKGGRNGGEHVVDSMWSLGLDNRSQLRVPTLLRKSHVAAFTLSELPVVCIHPP